MKYTFITTGTLLNLTCLKHYINMWYSQHQETLMMIITTHDKNQVPFWQVWVSVFYFFHRLLEDHNLSQTLTKIVPPLINTYFSLILTLNRVTSIFYCCLYFILFYTVSSAGFYRVDSYAGAEYVVLNVDVIIVIDHTWKQVLAKSVALFICFYSQDSEHVVLHKPTKLNK